MNPKHQRFDAVMAELKAEIDRLAQSDSRIGPLNNLYDRLQQSSSDIQAIEDNIDAFRREFLAPVEAELATGRRASYAFGVIGVVGAIFGIAYPLVATDPNTSLISGVRDSLQSQTRTLEEQHSSIESLQRISADVRSLVRAETFSTADRTPVSGEIELQRGRAAPLFAAAEPSLELILDDVGTARPADDVEPQIYAVIDVYIGGRRLGQSEIDQRLSVQSVWDRGRINQGRADTLYVFEQDVLVIDDLHRFAITKILSQAVLGRSSGDDRTAAYLTTQ